jgi:hypothetical protein
MTEDKQPNLEKWDDFAGEYLKADLIAEFPVKLVPLTINATYDDGRPRLIIEVEYNEKTWKIELNKTNQNFIRSKGIKSPMEIVGKVLSFDKIKVRNPSTNTQVDSLAIIDIDE